MYYYCYYMRRRIARRSNVYIPKCKFKDDDTSNVKILYDLMVKKTQFNDDDGKTLINVICSLYESKHKFLLYHYRYFMNSINCYLSDTDKEKIILTEGIAQIIKLTFGYHKLITYRSLNFMFGYYNNVSKYCIDVLFDTGYKFQPGTLINISYHNYTNENIENQDYINNNSLILMYIYIQSMVNCKKIIDVNYFNKFIGLMKTCNMDDININYVIMIIKELENINKVNDKINKENNTNNPAYDIKGLYGVLLNILANNQNNINMLCNMVSYKHFKQTQLLECILQNNNIVGKFLDNINIGYLNKNLIILFYALHCGYVPNIGLICRLLENGEDANCGKLILDNDCSNYVPMSFNKIIKIIDYMDTFGCVINNDMLDIALRKGYVYTSKLVIEKLGIIPNIDNLNMGAKSGNIALIKELLGYRMVPTEETLMNVVVGGKRVKDENNVSAVRARYGRRYSRVRKNRVKKGANIVKSKVDHDIIIIAKMLRDHGLVINLKCVSMLMSLRLCFDDLSIYGINYDEDLYFECFINDYFPNEYMDKFTIDKNLLIARRFDKHNIINVDKLLKLITDNGIIMDNYILDSVMNSSNSKIINEMFTKQKYVVPKISLYKSVNRMYDIKALRNYVEVNGVTKDVMIKV